MIFSYYFDTKKTHLLNCKCRALQFTEKAQGVIEIIFSAEIAEVVNGNVKKRETSVATFSFPPTPQGETKHDIDFTRVRYGDDKKWIFTITNNKDISQKLTVGLISEAINKNPLGADVYHDDAEYNVELKANNLSILENSYVPPVLSQTLVNATFDQPGYPERFSSYTASYDSVARNYAVKDFRQDFLEEIPEGVAFKIRLDVAPQSVEPVEGERIFDLVVPQLGRFSLNKTSFEYLIHNGLAGDVIRTVFDAEVKPSDFYSNGTMTSKAQLIIDGDGAGTLIVSYNGKTLTGTYDHTSTFKYIDFRGAYAGKII